MACCAFIAFLIGQCLAAFQSWRSRLARLLGLGGGAGRPAAALAPRWRKGLLVALVLELGFAAGCAIAAGFTPGAGAWSALCGTAGVLAAHP
jgi:hypothetical protein